MQWIRSRSWLLLLLPALVVTLFSLGAIAAGVDTVEFGRSTGTAWAAVVETSPAIARYLIRLERLIGVGYVALGSLWVMLALALRRRRAYAWSLLWSMPVTFAATAAVFQLHGAGGLAAYYLTLGALAVAGLFLTGSVASGVNH